MQQRLEANDQLVILYKFSIQLNQSDEVQNRTKRQDFSTCPRWQSSQSSNDGAGKIFREVLQGRGWAPLSKL
jgi:hypothetical protein